MPDAQPSHSVVHPKLGKQSLEVLAAELCTDPVHRECWFNKADLIMLFTRSLQGEPSEAFERVRDAAKNSQTLGGARVESAGQRRGMKYRFVLQETPLIGVPAVRELCLSQDAPTPSVGFRDFPSPTCASDAGRIEVHHGNNLEVTGRFPSSSFDLIYVDPPFNTGRSQSRTRIKTERDENGDRTGFQGRRYRTTVVGKSSYADVFDDYMAFLVPRLEEAYRLLKPHGSFFLHLDYREVHYAKVALDEIFGRDSFINEIIWAYDYGARATNRWSPKHDTILWYAKDPKNYCFNYDEIDRIPYMAPSLVGEEKAARGKTPTDAWWHTIVSPNGKEKTGYPTQKPLGVLTRIVRVHSRPGDRLLDFFAGSGSFGEAGAGFGRDVVLVDESPEAIAVMRRRFANYPAKFVATDVTCEHADSVEVTDASDVQTEPAVTAPGRKPAGAESVVKKPGREGPVVQRSLF